MARDFTEGKNSRNDGARKPGGYFKEGTGGHTSRGVYQETMDKGTSSGASRSSKTTRIGNLGTRTTGAAGKIKGV